MIPEIRLPDVLVVVVAKTGVLERRRRRMFRWVRSELRIV